MRTRQRRRGGSGAIGVVSSAVRGAAGMSAPRRRRLDVVLLLVAGLLVGAAAVAGAAAGDSERIAGMWTGAAVGADGGAAVTEVIDYDFGVHRRHGIFRDVPGLAPSARIRVSSLTAPVAVDIEPGAGRSGETRIRIGDPVRTATGRHRYTIDYPLGRVVQDGRLAWDAVGTAWPVPVGRVEIHVVAPFQLRAARCVQGVSGSQAACSVTEPEPGHLVARVDRLAAHEGVTLFADARLPLAAAPRLPAAPSGAAHDAGSGLLAAGLLAALAALVGAAPTSRLVRRAGRERVAAGGAADVAWAATDREVRIDAAELASLATVEFAPPKELTPAQGGVVLTESVQPQHKVAWLVGAAIDGYIDLEGSGPEVTLVRLPRRDGGQATVLLDEAFAGRERLSLGAYDPEFAVAWEHLGEGLEAWHRASGLWDPAGDRRRVRAMVLGAAAALGGLVVAVAGGAAANRWGASWLALAAAAALGAGAGVAAVVRAWELRVRTPAGSGLWLRVESFRRFLAESEAHHADEAAKRGRLLEYTAWAVAVGEVARWSRAVAASTVALSDPVGLRFAAIAPSLSLVTIASAVAPSSSGSGSGSGGGFSGGVGGGAGGGGGGSW